MNTPKKRLELTEADKRSPLWIALMDHFNERLEFLRTQNEGDKTENETANLRGRIAEVRAILALNKDRPDLEK